LPFRRFVPRRCFSFACCPIVARQKKVTLERDQLTAETTLLDLLHDSLRSLITKTVDLLTESVEDGVEACVEVSAFSGGKVTTSSHRNEVIEVHIALVEV
jgi:hypothetical protein